MGPNSGWPPWCGNTKEGPSKRPVLLEQPSTTVRETSQWTTLRQMTQKTQTVNEVLCRTDGMPRSLRGLGGILHVCGRMN